MNKAIILCTAAAGMAAVVACKSNADSNLQAKVDEYAVVEVSSPLLETLSDKDMQVLNLFRSAGRIMDDLFWQQTFGDKSLMEGLADPAARDFAMINYGPWDRLDDNAPFVDGYGPKPLGANYYPSDITAEEFAAFDDPDKNSLSQYSGETGTAGSNAYGIMTSTRRNLTRCAAISRRPLPSRRMKG